MAEHYKVQLGRAIATRRKQLGLTQTQLAHATHHKDGQTVSRWENGSNAPGDLEAVAVALDWTLAEMVNGIDPPNGRVARQLGIVQAAPDKTPDLSSEAVESERLKRIERKLDRVLAMLSKPEGALPGGGPLPALPPGPGLSRDSKGKARSPSESTPAEPETDQEEENRDVG